MVTNILFIKIDWDKILKRTRGKINKTKSEILASCFLQHNVLGNWSGVPLKNKPTNKNKPLNMVYKPLSISS